MSRVRHLLLIFAFALPLAACSSAFAQTRWGPPPNRVAFNHGYEHGFRAGEEDAWRGERFDYANERDYRRADSGFRSSYGNREFYRREFRAGFQNGYRDGYQRRRGGRGPLYGRGQYDSGWNARGVRRDPAFERGFQEGYEAGRNDVRRGDRYDPIGERRYRSGDRGYRRDYGSRDVWKLRYREGFKLGYDRGYRERSLRSR